MKIIISPAKKMRDDIAYLAAESEPVYLQKSKILLERLRSLSYEQLKEVLACSDALAWESYERYQKMDLGKADTPALLAYVGIQYQYMAPSVFEDGHFEYIQEHLCILSAFYGVLKAMDGVTPYRLEMKAKACIHGKKNLYEFWGSDLYEGVRDDSGIIINLASKEYSRCVEDWLTGDVRYISCVFGEEKIRDDKSVPGKKGWPPVVQKGTQAKMARGEMVRFAAQQDIRDWRELRGFNRLGYEFREEYSSESQLVFVKKKD